MFCLENPFLSISQPPSSNSFNIYSSHRLWEQFAICSRSLPSYANSNWNRFSIILNIFPQIVMSTFSSLSLTIWAYRILPQVPFRCVSYVNVVFPPEVWINEEWEIKKREKDFSQWILINVQDACHAMPSSRRP